MAASLIMLQYIQHETRWQQVTLTKMWDKTIFSMVYHRKCKDLYYFSLCLSLYFQFGDLIWYFKVVLSMEVLPCDEFVSCQGWW